jgi:hypothetical protein
MDVLSNFLNFAFILLCGWLAAYIAAKKGRSAIIWFLLGFFFNIFALLVLIFLPPAKKPFVRNQAPREDQKFDGTTIDVKPLATDPNAEEGLPATPESQEWYYLDPQHQQIGPISFQSVKDLYQTGVISSVTYLWCEGMREWRKLTDLNFKLS